MASQIFDRRTVGIPGPANSLRIGSVIQGTSAGATIEGESPNQTLNLVLVAGRDGSNVLPTDEAVAQTMVPAVGGTPGEPAPAYRSSPSGGDTNDSTKRLVLESYQRPERGPWGESIRLLNKSPQAKTMIAWYTPANPALPWDSVTNPMNTKADAWIGAHYAGQTDGTGIHGHISIETPMANGDLFSRFGIDFINQASKERGADITHTYVANSHFTHRQGDGAVFTISSGPGSSERRIEFSSAAYVPGNSPGYRDDTKRRWWIVTDQSPESGGNAGANFLLRRFADTGDLAKTAFWISRKTGNATFGEGVDQSARVAASWGGGPSHGFFSAPSETPAGGFAHFAAKAISAADRIMNVSVSGDANARFVYDANGKNEWGDGVKVRDTNLYRGSAGVLCTDQSIKVAKNLLINTTSVAAGTGVLAMANAQQIPTGNPSSGGVIFVEGGALKYRGSSGTVTTLGAA